MSGMILAELGKINLTKWLDVSTRDYRDGGHTLYYSSKTKKFMIVFYDKIKELEQTKITSKGRAEKDGIVQLNLLDELEKMHPFEVLRMEIRFCERRKLKLTLEKLGLQTKLTFENLFKQSISKAVLQDYWRTIEEGAGRLFGNNTDKSNERSEVSGTDEASNERPLLVRLQTYY